MSRLAIIGAGAWGTALCELWKRKGHETGLWSRRAPASQVLQHADAAVIAVSAQDVRSVLAGLDLPSGIPIIITAKGIERASGSFLDQVVEEAKPGHSVFILSGPSFAADVLAGFPTAVTLAGREIETTMQWAQALSLPTFRIYGSDDLRGVAIGGSLKNVLAIACGISDGEGLGDSAKAALLTRGFAELARLGSVLGGRSETLFGLSGLGDLILTASSPTSRNYSFGRRLGEGLSVAEALRLSKGTVEGAYSASVAVMLAGRYGVDVPISSAVHAIVDKNSPHRDEIGRLLSRPVSVEQRPNRRT